MRPVTINMQDTEDRQTITMLEGLLKQQRTYTDNAVAEAMRLRKDVEFLLRRSMNAGAFSHSSDRDTGLSSNSLVAIAYGACLETQSMPFDKSDLAACDRAYGNLPEHRKSGNALVALERAKAALETDAE